MQNYEKLSAVRKLVDIAESYSPLESDIVSMIDKIVSPPSAATTKCYQSSHQPVSPTIDELFLARKVGKIQAIKEYRNRTGLGLKESKDNIENAMHYFAWSFGDGHPNTYPGYLFESVGDTDIPF